MRRLLCPLVLAALATVRVVYCLGLKGTLSPRYGVPGVSTNAMLLTLILFYVVYMDIMLLLFFCAVDIFMHQ